MHHELKDSIELVAVGKHVGFGSGLVVHGLALEDDHEEAKHALALLEGCPVLKHAVVRKTALPTTIEEEFRVQNENNPEGHRWTVNNAWLEGTPEELSNVCLDAMVDRPNEKAFTLWYSMAPLRPLPDIAFSMQSDIYMSMYNLWEDPGDDAYNERWVRAQMKRIQPYTVGQYLGDSDFTAHQRQFMSVEHYQTLEQIRAKYDPQGRFHSYLTKGGALVNENAFE